MNLVRTDRFSINIHRLSGPDPSWLRPHDHGCHFFSFILKGGYTERLYRRPSETLSESSFREFKTLSGHVLRSNEAHRVVKCTPGTTTVFVTWGHQNRRPMAFTERGHLLYSDYYGKGFHIKDGDWVDEA